MRNHRSSTLVIGMWLCCVTQVAYASPPAEASSPGSAPNTAGTAKAASAKAPAPARTSTLSPERAAEQKLAARDAETVARGIDELGKLGGSAAANALALRLKRGLPPQLIEQAIATLGMLGKPSAIPVIAEQTMHRRASVRAAALLALGALRARGAHDQLVRGLDDPNLEVRVAAAQALAHAGTPRALPALWRAADRGLEPALLAVAAVARAEDLQPIVERVRTGDLGPLTPVLHTLLERGDLSAQAKLSLIDELAKLGSTSARVVLTQATETAKKDSNANLQKALGAAIKRIDLMQKGELATAEPTPTRAASFAPVHEASR